MVWGVAVQRGGLHRGAETGRGRVDFPGGAKYSEGGKTAFVSQEEVQWGETGLNGQDI